MSIFGPSYTHGSVPAQFAVHGGLIPVHGSTSASVGPAGTPLNTELNPDVGLDAGAASWTYVAGRTNWNGSSFAFVASGFTPTLTLGGTNTVVNTTGNTYSPGTYRFTMTVSAWTANSGTITAKLGAAEYQALFTPSPINAVGTFTADVVVTAQTTGKGFAVTGNSNANFEFDTLSVQRIA